MAVCGYFGQNNVASYPWHACHALVTKCLAYAYIQVERKGDVPMQQDEGPFVHTCIQIDL